MRPWMCITTEHMVYFNFMLLQLQLAVNKFGKMHGCSQQHAKQAVQALEDGAYYTTLYHGNYFAIIFSSTCNHEPPTWAAEILTTQLSDGNSMHGV